MNTLFERYLCEDIDKFKLASEDDRPTVTDWMYDHEGPHQYNTYRHFYYNTKPDIPGFYVNIGYLNRRSGGYTVYINPRGYDHVGTQEVPLNVSNDELYDFLAWTSNVDLPDNMIRDMVGRMREFIESPDGQPESS